MSDSGHLLHVVSAKESMSWRAFKSAFEYLLVTHRDRESNGEDTEIGKYLYRTVRALDILAYCDFEFSHQSKVYASPPVLVRLPLAGLPQAVLVGARSPSSLSKVKKYVREASGNIRMNVEESSANTPLVPQRVKVQADRPEALKTFASYLGVRFENTPPAWNLLSYAGSIEAYLDSLPQPRTGRLETWPSPSTFNANGLRFEPASGNDPNVRLTRYTHPTTTVPHFFLFNGDKRVEVDRDWGKYEILRRNKKRVLSYDERRFLLAVPSSISLPRLLARALSLCSGYAPSFVQATELELSIVGAWAYRLYRWIPPQAAQAIADKLDQRLIETKIDYDF